MVEADPVAGDQPHAGLRREQNIGIQTVRNGRTQDVMGQHRLGEGLGTKLAVAGVGRDVVDRLQLGFDL